ncbi:MAG: hypothetical protein WCY80_05755 [Candidatus Izemoplasmatales bacterium]
MGIVIAVGIIVVLITVYMLTYLLNEKTEKPEGCEDISCSGCKVDNCATRK